MAKGNLETGLHALFQVVAVRVCFAVRKNSQTAIFNWRASHIDNFTGNNDGRIGGKNRNASD
jgi:hypothetical protein